MKLLFVLHRIPYPPDKGDKIRSYHLVRHLAARHEVDVLALADDPRDLVHAEALARLARRVEIFPLAKSAARVRAGLAFLAPLLGRRPDECSLTAAWFAEPAFVAAVRAAIARGGYDAALAYSSSVAPLVSGFAGPRVLDFVDVDSAKWRAYADALPWASPKRWVYAAEAKRLAALEKRHAEAADAVVVCAEREAVLLSALAAPRRLAVIEHATDTDAFVPGSHPREGHDVVFTGAMDYRANVDAACAFAHDAFPLVRAREPRARFLVVGSNPAPAVRALASEPGVVVTGRVPDVRPYLQRAAVAVAPMRIARGIQSKVLEALASATPVVATRNAAAGLAVDALGEVPGLVRAEDAAAQAEAISRLLADPAARARLGAEGRAYVEEHWRWEPRLARLDRLLAEVVAASASGTSN